MASRKQHPKKNLQKSTSDFCIVGLGASAGGLDAFKKFLGAVPKNSGLAYVLVQHLDPHHESQLPELLQRATKLPVLEISDDVKVEPNHVYVIPSNKMLIANDGMLELSARPKKNLNLPIDFFLKSLAEVYAMRSIGVVLSGTGSDGTKGLKAVKQHGGITFAQDKKSAAYDGMPNNAMEAGVVDFRLPPEKMPKKIMETAKTMEHGQIDKKDQIKDAGEKEKEKENAAVFNKILSLLHIRKKTDFTYYKQSTIRRRILRRVALKEKDGPAEYLEYLRKNKQEQDLLYQDLLIPVTGFFRDSKIFKNLCTTAIPEMVKNHSPGERIRVWSAGCSTGEEAYSIAICLLEHIQQKPSTKEIKLQIFGTDISEPAIAKARTGTYSKNELEGLSAERLNNFFTKTNGHYQINKEVRDLCIFAAHNFLKDPPFGKLDLITCRNVLIYMEPFLQKKALTTFHYALERKGILLLGKSETTTCAPDLFNVVKKQDKLFSPKDKPGKFMPVATKRKEEGYKANYIPDSQIASRKFEARDKTKRTDFEKTADEIILGKYTPSGVVVNEDMDIVHFRGNTSKYLEQSPGKPTHNLLKMAKMGLSFELRNILHKAKKEAVSRKGDAYGKNPVVKKDVPIEVNGHQHK